MESIIIKGYNEVECYDKHGELVIKTIDRFFSDIKKELKRKSKVFFEMDDSTKEYYYGGRKIIFNNRQIKELNNPNSDLSKKLEELLKLSKQKKAYYEVLNKGDFDNVEETLSFIKFLEGNLSTESKSYETDRNRIKAAK